MFNYYVAHIGVASCLADIRLNDVPLFIGEEEAYHAFSLPLNQYIDHCGVQMLTVAMMPSARATKPTKGSIWVEVTLFDGSETRLRKVETVTSAELSTDGKTLLSSIRIVNKPFEASIDFPVTRWRDCQRIEDNQLIHTLVFSFYSRLYKIFKNKQYSVYESMIVQREQDVVRSIGLDVAEIKKRQYLLLNELSSGFEIEELTGEETLHYYAGGKAVSLLTPELDSALRFYNEEDDELLSLDILVGIKNGFSTVEIL